MRTRERHVHFYDLQPTTTFLRCDTMPRQMSTGRALELAWTVWSALPGTSVAKDGGRQISIDAWEYNSHRGEHYLVINCADPGLADPAFKHLRTGSARMAGKQEEEAIDTSAHILFKPPTSGATPAVMLMTAGAGVSSAKVGALLTRLLRAAKKLHPQDFRRDHPNAVPGEKLGVRVRFEVTGHQGRFLKQILATGEVAGMELIAESRSAIDSDKNFHVTAHVLQVEAVAQDRKITISGLIDFIKRTQPNMTKARIRFKEDPTAKIETHTFEANELESAFVRKDRITFDTDIASRYVVVNHTVVDRLRTLL